MTRIGLRNPVVLWNIGAFGLMALTGLVVNVAIARRYPAADLGTFSTVFAVYTVLSQVAVFGVHQAVGKFVAEAQHSPAQRTAILYAGLLVTGAVAAVVSVLVWLGAPLVDPLFSCAGLGPGLREAAPGLFFFALNKVFLLYLNGLLHLRLLSVLQGLRAVALLGSCAYLVWQKRPVSEVCACFFHAEAVLFLASAGLAVSLCGRPALGELCGWARRLLVFGAHALPGGLCLALNTRLDVLMLNFLVTDRLVGIYSFCALFGEGLHQLNLVFSAIYNPQVSRLHASGAGEELAAFVRHQRNRLWLVFGVLCVLPALGFPFLADLASGHPEYREGWWCFAVMMAGLWCCAGYLPFNQLLLQAGRPVWHSHSQFTAVACNALVCALAIPWLGIVGAALALVLSWVCQLVIVVWVGRTHLGLRI